MSLTHNSDSHSTHIHKSLSVLVKPLAPEHTLGRRALPGRPERKKGWGGGGGGYHPPRQPHRDRLSFGKWKKGGRGLGGAD